MKLEPTETPGALANCERCGRQIRVADARRKESTPVRLAKVPKGVCPECVMTQFLYNTYPVNMQIDQAGPELLLKPLIREAFVMSGILKDCCDLDINEIDWNRLVDNWKLPVKVPKSGRNPYRMGDHARQQKALDDAGITRPGKATIREDTSDWTALQLPADPRRRPN